ncbi:MAG: nucleotidyltransferase [Sclerophora amabilis]|nr:MAG: nucleotidyltransferase [Sclerophora amabilis]
MPPSPCAQCKTSRALIIRPKNHQKLCKACFIRTFETEIHYTIRTNGLFAERGERVAIGASGGKDSTVLASVLKTLNERHDYGLELVLLSIDEGIRGYRDDSLETVKRNARQYAMPLEIVGYDQLYGWTMDQVVEQVGKKGNCTYCGVFRRQALDRGAARLGVKHVVTGHNADDVAETVMMNLLRGDLPRLARATSIMTGSKDSPVRRSKPLKYAYEKEIVLYAHHKKLDYFSTECIYSPEAFRGSARALIKNLERVRPSAILDVVRSGEDMAKLVPEEVTGAATASAAAASAAAAADVEGNKDDDVEEEEEDQGMGGGCGSTNGRVSGGEMAMMEQKLLKETDDAATTTSREIEITSASIKKAQSQGQGQPHDRQKDRTTSKVPASSSSASASSSDPRHPPFPTIPTPGQQHDRPPPHHHNTNTSKKTPRKLRTQHMGRCARCGYLSSQDICKACTLLEGLNKNRPKIQMQIEVVEREGEGESKEEEKDEDGGRNVSLRRRMERVGFEGGGGGG